MTFTEVDLSLILDALLAYERATDAEGRAAATDPDHCDYGDPAALDRLAARCDHATGLAHRVGLALDGIAQDRAERAGVVR